MLSAHRTDPPCGFPVSPRFRCQECPLIDRSRPLVRPGHDSLRRYRHLRSLRSGPKTFTSVTARSEIFQGVTGGSEASQRLARPDIGFRSGGAARA